MPLFDFTLWGRRIEVGLTPGVGFGIWKVDGYWFVAFVCVGINAKPGLEHD